jgi:nucleoside-diphosphate-sugar epimerase
VTHRRVLVTGATGFVGRWSVPALLAQGCEVHAVASPQAARALPPQLAGAEVHAADLLNEAHVDTLLRRVAATHLLHFAWIATPGVYWTSSDNARWLAASRHLLQAFGEQGGRRAVMAGSCAEYDWSKVSVCDEASSPLAVGGTVPITPYAASKLELQNALAEFSRSGDFSSAWGRIFFQFGPDEHPDRLVPSVIISLLAGREALCSHGRQVRSFLHVADVGAAFAALLAGDVQGAVNIGSDAALPVAELIDRIARQIGRPELVRLGARPAAAGEPALLLPKLSRLHDEVRWRPRIGLNEAIADTIQWWRARA